MIGGKAAWPHLFADDDRAGDEIMQGLALSGKRDDQIPDEYDQRGKPRGQVARRRAPDPDPPALEIGDLDAERALAGGGLVVSIVPPDAMPPPDWPATVVIPCGMGDARNLIMALAGDACIVIGGRAAPAAGRPTLDGGAADAQGDHRMAMAFAIAALGADTPSTIEGADAVVISYPDFFEALGRLTS